MTTNAGAETMNKATIGFTNPRQAGDERGAQGGSLLRGLAARGACRQRGGASQPSQQVLQVALVRAGCRLGKMRGRLRSEKRSVLSYEDHLASRASYRGILKSSCRVACSLIIRVPTLPVNNYSR
jgi:hypothetical protein